jgi:glycosyltransferase involved in cell wall biosynthesis
VSASAGGEYPVLAIHNAYQQWGGEDAVFQQEAEMLERRGHRVIRLVTAVPNELGMSGRIRVAGASLWSSARVAEITALVREHDPAIAHVHNFFPLMSPSLYWALHELGVPVVQTLHNFRFTCPAGTLFRAGRVCESCLGRPVAAAAALHACYRGSRIESVGAVASLAAYRLLGVWRRWVRGFIALTPFARDKAIAGGIPAGRVFVKPNFVAPDPHVSRDVGNYAVYVGRLSPEKGLETLLEAWESVEGVPLRIVGDGPLRSSLERQAAATGVRDVEFVGRRSRQEVMEHLGEARFLVLPSLCYEGYPLAVVEAFARGIPVIASRRGGLRSIVADGRTGLLVQPGSASEFASAVRLLWSDTSLLETLRRGARREYEESYTEEVNYRLLMGIYEQVVSEAGGGDGRA